MSQPLRQSTAFSTLVGPVLDADGAVVTTCAIGDFRVRKPGSDPAALHASATLAHKHTGQYVLTGAANDADTVGELVVTLNKGANVCAPVRFTVYTAAVYDVLFAGDAAGPAVDPVSIGTFEAAALAQLASVRAISLTSVFLANGDLEIQIGDDYLAETENALDWTNAAGDWGDLTSCTLELRSSRTVDGVETANDVISGEILIPDGPGQKIRVELPADWTNALAVATYLYQVVRITAGGKERTLRRGLLHARKRVKEAA